MFDSSYETSSYNANSLKLNILITTIHLQKFSKTSSNNYYSFADTQNFCHSQNVCALKIL